MVIVIAAILLALSFPAMKAMHGNRVSAGLNIVSVAADAARRYATRDIEFNKDLNSGTTGDYSGTAILFTSSEMRLVENDQAAQHASNRYLENFKIDVGLGIPWDVNLNGFRDIQGRDYIRMPSGVGVVGIARNATGPSGLLLYAPPFAVRFDEHGHLVSGLPTTQKDKNVYYNGAEPDNNWYDRNDDRPNAYDPGLFDPQAPNYDSANFDSDAAHNRHYLPFEEIVTVVGVIVFDKTDAYSAFGVNALTADAGDTALKPDGDGNPKNDIGEWILANGTAVFFNRYTGGAIRND